MKNLLKILLVALSGFFVLEMFFRYSCALSELEYDQLENDRLLSVLRYYIIEAR